MSLLDISSAVFIAAFLLYSGSFMLFTIAIMGRKWSVLQAGGTYSALGQNCFYFLFNRSYLSSYLFLYTLGGLRAYSGQQHV